MVITKVMTMTMYSDLKLFESVLGILRHAATRTLLVIAVRDNAILLLLLLHLVLGSGLLHGHGLLLLHLHHRGLLGGVWAARS